jgi:DNA-binding Lrp family transcriptional regulator
MKIDNINHQILQELSKNAKITNIELAEYVNLSPSACLRRVQELEKAGVITGYAARLNRSKLNRGFLAYVMVGLSKHTKQAQQNFEIAIAASPQVLECHNITGTFEYLLRVESADLSSYKAFHADRLGTIPEVAHLQTLVVMDSPKDERG